MTTQTKSKSHFIPRFVFVDSIHKLPASWPAGDSLIVSKPTGLANAVEASSKDSLWVVANSANLDAILEAVLSRHQQNQAKTHLGDLLLCEPVPVPRLGILSPMRQWFSRVAGELPSYKSLPWEQLSEVLNSKSKRNLFIGGSVNKQGKTLTLTRGDLSTVTVSLKMFEEAGASKRDLEKFELDDFGYAVRFGNTEASAHSILYEVDADYRREMNAKRRAEDKGFGPSLRRLRIMRHLGREAFGGISAKTIARIERGETGKPQGTTLATIAKTLGVPPQEVESY